MSTAFPAPRQPEKNCDDPFQFPQHTACFKGDTYRHRCRGYRVGPVAPGGDRPSHSSA
ncbi:MAG: hypothetical protein HC857_10485 [Synechococcales cyanobacterium RU_4_20]|nr:hypothetical protein [Synechococcales cyanobacterium RU_4_20]